MATTRALNSFQLDTTLRPASKDGHAEKERRPGIFDVTQDEEDSMIMEMDLETMGKCQSGVLNCLDLKLSFSLPERIE
jgi:hypothetical protein